MVEVICFAMTTASSGCVTIISTAIHKFFQMQRKLLPSRARPAIFDRDCPVFSPTALCQSPYEGGSSIFLQRRRSSSEEPSTRSRVHCDAQNPAARARCRDFTSGGEPSAFDLAMGLLNVVPCKPAQEAWPTELLKRPPSVSAMWIGFGTRRSWALFRLGLRNRRGPEVQRTPGILFRLSVALRTPRL
jgi:hypothetical protein